MSKITDLVNGLGAGWTVVGNGMPIEETTSIANPAAGDTAPEGTPARIAQGTGRYYVIVQDSEGHQRALYLKASPIKGGLDVPQTGVTKPENEYRGDLRTLDWQQAGAVADVPEGQKTPTATGGLDKLDSQGNVIKPGDTTTKATQMRDPKTGTTFNLVTDPAGTIHDVGNDVWLVKPDGTYSVVGSKPDKPSQFNVPGVGLVDYDPSKPDGSRTTVLIKTPDKTVPTTEVRNGQTYQYNNDTKTWDPTNLPLQQDIGYTYNDPNSDTIVFYDKQGKEVSRTTKPNWKPEPKYSAGQGPAADTVSPTIPTINPQTGALEFVDNPNQIKASQAVSDLAGSLGLKVAAGSMSEKQAQDLITGAVNTMNAQTSRMTAETQAQESVRSAAGDILANTRGNAQTGAGLLQNRVTAAQGMLGQVLGLAQSGQRSGNFGGGLLSAPAGLGAGLVSGIGDWTASLMGGQGTLDSAARLVQMADPKSNLADPAMQSAVGALTQMLDRYHQVNGQPHPAVAATQAAQQSQQQGGVVAPATYASGGAGAVASGYGATGGRPFGNAPNGFPAPVTSNPAYASTGLGAVNSGFAAPKTGSTIVINA